MLNKPVELSNSVSYETTAKTIEINDQFSLFEAEHKTIKSGKVISNNKTTGVAKTEYILHCLEQCKPVEANSSIFILTKELRRLLRLYGFPNHSMYTELVNPETTKTEKPMKLFLEEVKNQDISLKAIVENPELIQQLAFADHSELVTYNIFSGKFVNQAIFTDRFNLSGSYVRDFRKAVNKLIENKRVAYTEKGYNREPVFYVPGNGLEIYGHINFSDEEWENMMIECEKTRQEQNATEGLSHRFFGFSQLAFEKNWLGISEMYNGYECGDVYVYTSEDEDD